MSVTHVSQPLISANNVPAFLLQSVKEKCYDDHSAVYHLLEDKLQRHLLKSHSSTLNSASNPGSHLIVPTNSNSSYSNIPHDLSHPPTTQRRSSITTGVGECPIAFAS